jgi:lipopolysaccharide transport system ATP-binding protein
MSDVVIKVENLGKQYRLGSVGTGTISHDLNRWWAKVRGKEDPFLKIGEANDRSKKGDSDLVWALKDINFEVKQGEVLGIIGRNGAGKSTLLKILSRVTGPTTGDIKVKGRIASLLEVGTGFHPELTGRENIFLNGAILGMSKQEIKSKFDEIVDFSGVERYIDTPVKRYSSGMYVRLAFAVAAHLEPEILIVDEVLAVGDAEFQKKCIGKMKDVSGQGRTVLFVSHNMAAVNQLCNTGLVMQNGTLIKQGSIDEVIPFYMKNTLKSEINGMVEYPESNKVLQVKRISLQNEMGSVLDRSISTNESFYVEVEYLFKEEIKKCNLTLIITNDIGEVVWFLDRTDYYKEFFVAEKGSYKAKIKIPNPLLKPGQYTLTIGLADTQAGIDDHKHQVLKFDIENMDSIRINRSGNLFIPTEWQMQKNEVK